MESGLTYSIVRPTAFFKSLSGQVDRVKRGKPFLVFGDGAMTACKPISDDDLGRFLAECLDDESRRNRVLPIGGPGEAITPRQQGEYLFALLGRKPRFRHVPVALLDAIVLRWTVSAASFPLWRKKRNWPVSAVTTPPSRCSFWIRRRGATTPPRRPRPEPKRCSTSMRA